MEPRNYQVYSNAGVRSVSPLWSPIVMTGNTQNNHRGEKEDDYRIIKRSFAFDEWDEDSATGKSTNRGDTASYYSKSDDAKEPNANLIDQEAGKIYQHSKLWAVWKDDDTMPKETASSLPEAFPKTKRYTDFRNKLPPLDTYMTVIPINDMISKEASQGRVGGMHEDHPNESSFSCDDVRNSVTYWWSSSESNFKAYEESENKNYQAWKANVSSPACPSDNVPEYIFCLKNE